MFDEKNQSKKSHDTVPLTKRYNYRTILHKTVRYTTLHYTKVRYTTVRSTTAHYTTVRYKTVKCYETVSGSKWYITGWNGYQTVHITKRYTVTKWHTVKKRTLKEQYIIITVQYHNGLVRWPDAT